MGIAGRGRTRHFAKMEHYRRRPRSVGATSYIHRDIRQTVETTSRSYGTVLGIVAGRAYLGGERCEEPDIDERRQFIHYLYRGIIVTRPGQSMSQVQIRRKPSAPCQ